LNDMFQDLLTFLNECVPLSITSMASSNDWSVHFPFFLFGGTLLTIWHGYLVHDASCGATFSWFKVVWSIITLRHL
jgi:hypothetical protein